MGINEFTSSQWMVPDTANGGLLGPNVLAFRGFPTEVGSKGVAATASLCTGTGAPAAAKHASMSLAQPSSTLNKLICCLQYKWVWWAVLYILGCTLLDLVGFVVACSYLSGECRGELQGRAVTALVCPGERLCCTCRCVCGGEASQPRLPFNFGMAALLRTPSLLRRFNLSAHAAPKTHAPMTPEALVELNLARTANAIPALGSSSAAKKTAAAANGTANGHGVDLEMQAVSVTSSRGLRVDRVSLSTEASQQYRDHTAIKFEPVWMTFRCAGCHPAAQRLHPAPARDLLSLFSCPVSAVN